LCRDKEKSLKIRPDKAACALEARTTAAEEKKSHFSGNLQKHCYFGFKKR
jgi:hypothetical protein